MQINSEALSRLRQNCAQSLQADAGYAGPGHISLAYVVAEYFDQAKEFIERHNYSIRGCAFPLTSIYVRHPDGVTTQTIHLPAIVPTPLDMLMLNSSTESEKCVLCSVNQELTLLPTYDDLTEDELHAITSLVVFVFMGKSRSHLVVSSYVDHSIRLISGAREETDSSLVGSIYRIFSALVGKDLAKLTLIDTQCYLWSNSTAVFVACSTDLCSEDNTEIHLGIEIVCYPVERLQADMAECSSPDNILCAAVLTNLSRQFRAHGDVVDEIRGIKRYKFENYFGVLTCAEVVELWAHGEHHLSEMFTLILSDILLGAAKEHGAFFWECAPFQLQSLGDHFEFVIVPTNPDRFASASWHQFRDKFSKCVPGQLIATFPNPRGDAVLVSPIPQTGTELYGHLAQFLENLTDSNMLQCFWLSIGIALQSFLIEREIGWLSTSGLGVPWLHARLDTTPKYYEYEPYRVANRKMDAS